PLGDSKTQSSLPRWLFASWANWRLKSRHTQDTRGRPGGCPPAQTLGRSPTRRGFNLRNLPPARTSIRSFARIVRAVGYPRAFRQMALLRRNAVHTRATPCQRQLPYLLAGLIANLPP